MANGQGGNFLTGLLGGFSQGVADKRTQERADVANKLLKAQIKALQLKAETHTGTRDAINRLFSVPGAETPQAPQGLNDPGGLGVLPVEPDQPRPPTEIGPAVGGGGVLEKIMALDSRSRLALVGGDLSKLLTLETAARKAGQRQRFDEAVQGLSSGQGPGQPGGGGLELTGATQSPTGGSLQFGFPEVGKTVSTPGGGQTTLLDKRGRVIGTVPTARKRNVQTVSVGGRDVLVDIGDVQGSQQKIIGLKPGAKVPAKALDELGATVAVVNKLGDLETIAENNPEFFGKLNALSKTVALRFGKLIPDEVVQFAAEKGVDLNPDTEAAAAYATIGSVFNIVSAMRAGKTLTKDEIQRLEVEIPTKWDESPVFRAKLTNFKATLKGIIQSKIGVLKSSGVSVGDLESVFGPDEAAKIAGGQDGPPALRGVPAPSLGVAPGAGQSDNRPVSELTDDELRAIASGR